MKIIRYADSQGNVGHAALQSDGSALRLNAPNDLAPTNEVADVARLLAPVVPPAILGIGLNYRRHAQELNVDIPTTPIVFFKNPASLIGPDESIVLPSKLKSDSVDYECELAIVVGRGPDGESCRDVSVEQAKVFVRGFTCANDVSARDHQLKLGGGQWSRGKSFDTFCPLGPCLVTLDELENPDALSIRTRLNDEIVQDWNTNDLIFGVSELIAYLSADTTLLPDTVILTGTPHGVGMAQKPPRFLQDGDVVTVEIDGIGALSNPVRDVEPA